jgi:FAD/FMN-containing dehydrogenase
MKSFSIDGSGVAKIQTGNRLGDVAQKLWDNGQRALPHGTCPYVRLALSIVQAGIYSYFCLLFLGRERGRFLSLCHTIVFQTYTRSQGHAAFGGYGPFSRVAGLLHDRITAAEVVLANGTLTTASATQNSELFWALRGSAASYAIVTQWTFATLAAPPTVIGYSIDYSSTLSASKIASLLGAWQSLAMAVPKEMAMIAVTGKDGDGGLYLQVGLRLDIDLYTRY